jgi:hypothetical protein
MNSDRQTDVSVPRAALYQESQRVPGVRTVVVKSEPSTDGPAPCPVVLVWPWRADLLVVNEGKVTLAVRLLQGPTVDPDGWAILSAENAVNVVDLPNGPPDANLLGLIGLKHEPLSFIEISRATRSSDVEQLIVHGSTWPDVLEKISPKVAGALRTGPISASTPNDAAAAAAGHAVSTTYTRFMGGAAMIDGTLCRLLHFD